MHGIWTYPSIYLFADLPPSQCALPNACASICPYLIDLLIHLSIYSTYYPNPSCLPSSYGSKYTASVYLSVHLCNAFNTSPTMYPPCFLPFYLSIHDLPPLTVSLNGQLASCRLHLYLNLFPYQLKHSSESIHPYSWSAGSPFLSANLSINVCIRL